MRKIIGFCISRELISFNPDLFKTGISKYTFKSSNYFICIWGFGDFKSLIKKDYFSLSFSNSKDLLDRNVVVSFKGRIITIENDWLGSIPVFFNRDKKIISTIPNLCLTDNIINHEGLGNYFEFGYSVFGKTPFESVQFMRYFSKIILSENQYEIVYKDDPVASPEFSVGALEEEKVLDLIQDYISKIEEKTDGDIVIPTSGGFDSRLLNIMVRDKTRVKSFTYGISRKQSKSFEVIHAKKLSSLLKIEFNQVTLDHYHDYFKDWFSLYGISTHLHGMYHIEFYTKIIKNHNLYNPVLMSGIIGDLWSNSNRFLKIEIKRPDDILNLGLSHEIRLENKHINFVMPKKDIKDFFLNNKKLFDDNRMKAIYTVRFKIILLSYLTQLPEYFGIPVCTPFLNYDVVRSILAIKETRRRDRLWQQDFFNRSGCDLESMNLKSSKSNRLNFEIAKKNSLEPINIELMSEFVNNSRLRQINKVLSNQDVFSRFKDQLLFTPMIGRILGRLGFKNEFLKALNEYYVIKSFEKGLSNES